MTIDPDRGRWLTFGGESSCTIAPGATIQSDPVDMEISAFSVLAVTVRLGGESMIETFHWEGRSTAQLINSADIAAAAPSILGTTTARILVMEILVEAQSKGTIVALGDSITDGAGASLDADKRWPDILADRLSPRGFAVLNAGISGAQLLRDGMGVNLLARFDRDVLSQPDVLAVVMKIGTNDLGFAGTPFLPKAELPSLSSILQAYCLLTERARGAGIKIIGATLAPFQGALPETPFAENYHTPQKEALRLAINDWICRSDIFDGVVDFATALADPSRPGHLAAPYDSGDHLHPNDAGNAVMANAIDTDRLGLGEVKDR